jgi:hypothetical protein
MELDVRIALLMTEHWSQVQDAARGAIPDRD